MTEREKKENTVETKMDAEAILVSLLSCEDKTYIADEVGSAKYIIPT